MSFFYCWFQHKVPTKFIVKLCSFYIKLTANLAPYTIYITINENIKGDLELLKRYNIEDHFDCRVALLITGKSKMIFTTKSLLAQNTRQYFQQKCLEFKFLFTKENYWVIPKYNCMTIFLLTYMIDYIINFISEGSCQRKRLHKRMEKVYFQIKLEENSSNLLCGN